MRYDGLHASADDRPGGRAVLFSEASALDLTVRGVDEEWAGVTSTRLRRVGARYTGISDATQRVSRLG
jgi:hypothetical protein